MDSPFISPAILTHTLYLAFIATKYSFLKKIKFVTQISPLVSSSLATYILLHVRIINFLNHLGQCHLYNILLILRISFRLIDFREEVGVERCVFGMKYLYRFKSFNIDDFICQDIDES